MGLGTTHNCWHGPYSSFGRWRAKLCEVAGYPPLNEFVGYGGTNKYDWANFRHDPLSVLMDHSDCDGSIEVRDLIPLAERLEKLAEKLPDDENYPPILGDKGATLRFAKGLRAANVDNLPVEFH